MILDRLEWAVLLLQGATLSLLLIFVLKSRRRFRFQDREFRVLRQELQNAISITALGFRFPVFFDGASIDSFHAKYLIQKLVSWTPKTIVELGSGTSTVLTARVMQALKGGDYEHISVDHDASFLQITKKFAELNGVADCITFLHCPLRMIQGLGISWYADLPQKLGNRRVDLLIVDGPPAYLEETADARYPALPVLHSNLSAQCVIILDDANRDGEKAIIDRWLKEYPDFTVKYVRRGKGVAVLTR